MPNQSNPQKENIIQISALEFEREKQLSKDAGYIDALRDIADGATTEGLRAKVILEQPAATKKSWMDWSNKNVASIVALTSIVVGAFFSVAQCRNTAIQIQATTDKGTQDERATKEKSDFDRRVAKIDAVNKLAPSLSSTDLKTKILAVSALNGSKLFEPEEIITLVDPEALAEATLDIDKTLSAERKKSISSLLAEASQKLVDRIHANEKINENAPLILAQRAIDIYEINALAHYRKGSRLQDMGDNTKNYSAAIDEFELAIKYASDPQNASSVPDIKSSAEEHIAKMR